MRFAGFSLALYFLLAFALGGYGASIAGRLGLFIGSAPGILGLCGVCLWLSNANQALTYDRRATGQRRPRASHLAIARHAYRINAGGQ